MKLFKSLFIKFFVFLLLNYQSSLYLLDTSPLVRVTYCGSVLVCGLLFHFLNSIFQAQDLGILYMNIIYSDFFEIECYHCLNPH